MAINKTLAITIGAAAAVAAVATYLLRTESGKKITKKLARRGRDMSAAAVGRREVHEFEKNFGVHQPI